MPREPKSSQPKPAESRTADPADFDVSEPDIDAAVAACDGDARATIRALLVAYAMLERDMSLMTSAGFARRPMPPRRPG
ncbi:hypothetical protein V5F77_18120 [Xanthobacter sp. DSM 24535]|uniref:hypothetical protein n=1 Tax=Roseixanthobacter psychrophilus TaxID=3119917 RepID=UPI003726CBD8